MRSVCEVAHLHGKARAKSNSCLPWELTDWENEDCGPWKGALQALFIWLRLRHLLTPRQTQKISVMPQPKCPQDLGVPKPATKGSVLLHAHLLWCFGFGSYGPFNAKWGLTLFVSLFFVWSVVWDVYFPPRWNDFLSWLETRSSPVPPRTHLNPAPLQAAG